MKIDSSAPLGTVNLTDVVVGYRPDSDPLTPFDTWTVGTLLAPAFADATAKVAVALRAASGSYLDCDQRQRYAVTANTWFTLEDRAGDGTLEYFWMALDRNSGSGAPRNARLRITFNGAAIPQFGGTAGVILDDLFGVGRGVGLQFRNDVFGVSENSAGGYSAFCRHPMPFSNGIKIEINFTNSVNGLAWMGAEIGARRQLGLMLASEDWVMHADQFDFSPVALAEQTIIDVPSQALLKGINIRFTPGAGGSNLYYMEGDFKGYRDGEVTPSYRSSGTEDFFLSSYYFKEGKFVTNNVGMTYLDTDDGRCSAYRYYPESSMPGGEESFRFSWAN